MKMDELKGEWALVTGASAGIGREYALALARAGMNVVLVARRLDRLQALAATISETAGTKTLVIAQDLGVAGAAARVAEQVNAASISIRLLVNNAAFGRWGRFGDSEQAVYAAMLQTNVTSLTELCRAFMPALAKNAPSAVVNVASGAAYQPVPYMAAYAASKAFVLNFSQALHGEWRDQGILVQTLVPGPTDTEFDHHAGAYQSALQTRGPAEKVVADSMAALATGQPVALNARGTLKQRIFAALFPPRFVIEQVGKMFRPPA
ncbi:MAG: SDR family NAD(P)-dependent oxidoreductase [Rhodocyclaceae bacterium]|nr:SDR family NAD(P)-dependent oxidoreductase [Rhodocyclaceae bacterium]